MCRFIGKILPLFFLIQIFFGSSIVFAQGSNINIPADSLIQKATISLSPRTGTFSEGATFEVPIFIDTQGRSVNTFQLHIKFDSKKLSMLQPSGSRSIIGVWIEPPSYSNVTGELKMTGVIPGGINTKSGLITTITFKAIATGNARVYVSEESEILANDGLGTPVQINFDNVLYAVIPKAPDGVKVFSETHPLQDRYYRNNSPIISWEKPADVTAFSYEVDNLPGTVPDTKEETTDTTISLPNLKEGLTYFHIRAAKKGVWGGTTHFLIRVDTTAPAAFTPKAEIYSDTVNDDRALLSFFTTDSLSGIDHYEVAVIDKKDKKDVSPLFVETQSPYQLPIQSSGDIRAIVRVFDSAGNTHDESIDINLSQTFMKWLRTNLVAVILGSILIFLLIELLIHYLFGHNILKILLHTFQIVKKEEDKHHMATDKDEYDYFLKTRTDKEGEDKVNKEGEGK